MKKGIMKGLLTVLAAVCVGVFAGNVTTYRASAEETVEKEEINWRHELIIKPLSIIDEVLPIRLQSAVPQEAKETFRGCVASVSGITGSVALGIAAVALLKKKK